MTATALPHALYTTLISVAQLQDLQGSGAPLMVFDCSSDLMKPESGPAAYAQAHIPGAAYAHLDTALSDKSGAPDAASGGRHPLPSREKFAAWLGSVGFANDMQAVVYDRNGANYCGRLWWMLRWCGHEAVAVLDGGLQAWQAAGLAVQAAAGVADTSGAAGVDGAAGVAGTSGTAGTAGDAAGAAAVIANAHPPKKPTNFKIVQAQQSLFATKDIANNLQNPSRTIIDARAAPRYLGEVEPLDPIAGHIPGALNRPFAHNIGADGKFKPAQVLREEFLALLGGRDPAQVVHHCGSGVSAVPNLLAMQIAGLGNSGLYAGSWSEWSNTPGLPVAKG
jgi:thiosulfate/3-mercaptopyruvate sulfurtransferase